MKYGQIRFSSLFSSLYFPISSLSFFNVTNLGPKNMGPTSSHTREPNIKFIIFYWFSLTLIKGCPFMLFDQIFSAHESPIATITLFIHSMLEYTYGNVICMLMVQTLFLGFRISKWIFVLNKCCPLWSSIQNNCFLK